MGALVAGGKKGFFFCHVRKNREGNLGKVLNKVCMSESIGSAVASP